MSDLNADQITDIRRNWIRDEWRDSPVFRGMSLFNVATKKEFFTDDQIKAIDDYVSNEYAEELSELEFAKTGERIVVGDDETTAATVSSASRTYARYRLIRAEAWERMVNDPWFRSMFEKKDSALFDRMTAQIKVDRKFVLGRTGLVTVPLRRA